MDRWSTAGWVVLVVGLLLLASAVSGMGQDVVAGTSFWTHRNYQSRGPVDLPGGSYSFWVEDSPSWQEDPWSIDIYLNRSDDLIACDYPDKTSGRSYRTIEGFRCFLAAVVWDVPGGEFWIDLEVEWEGLPISREVEMFVRSSAGPLVVVGLVGGATMAAIGVATVAMRKWPGKKE